MFDVIWLSLAAGFKSPWGPGFFGMPGVFGGREGRGRGPGGGHLTAVFFSFDGGGGDGEKKKDKLRDLFSGENSNHHYCCSQNLMRLLLKITNLLEDPFKFSP